MEELMKINAKIRKQQIGRLFAAGVCACCGIGLLASYSYQKGIEYVAMMSEIEL